MDMERVIFFKANIGEGIWSEGLRKKFDLCPISASKAALSPQRSYSPNLGREGVQELILNKHMLCRKLWFFLKQCASEKAKDFSNPLADKFLPILTE